MNDAEKMQIEAMEIIRKHVSEMGEGHIVHVEIERETEKVYLDAIPNHRYTGYKTMTVRWYS